MKNMSLLLSGILLLSCALLLSTQFVVQSTSAVKVKQTVANKQIELAGNEGTYFQFTVPKGVSDVYLSGNIKVVGGILTNIYMGIYYAENCPSNNTVVYFQQCKPIRGGYYENGQSFGLYIPSGHKYYILFKNFALLGEEKIVKPTITVSYNK